MLIIVTALSLILGLVQSSPIIDPTLTQTLQSKGTANILLTLTHSPTSQILNEVQTRKFNSRAEKLQTIAQTLKDAATRDQFEIRQFLEKEKNPSASVKTFWITNKIIVRNADSQLVEKLLKRRDISEIRLERNFPLESSIDLINGDLSDQPTEGEQWGIVNMEAPKVWESGIKGQGVVAGIIDTGVRGTHEALKDNHRAEYGWFDPEQGSIVANDPGGHGSHVMGILVGKTQGIGVAPDSQWIACIGCEPSTCSEFALISCGEFMACPTDVYGNNSNCAMAPNLVSNSWAGGQSDPWYDDIIKTWIAGDIVPVFGLGNGGPGCKTAWSPGDSPFAIGVGSITKENTVSQFSSVGPTVVGNLIKPDIASPGSNIFSSYNSGDRSYATMSGTSMATPHAAGLVALLLSANSNLTVAQVKSALEAGALATVVTGNNCGGIDESVYPNHHVGAGRINAATSINEIKKMNQF